MTDNVPPKMPRVETGTVTKAAYTEAHKLLCERAKHSIYDLWLIATLDAWAAKLEETTDNLLDPEERAKFWAEN